MAREPEAVAVNDVDVAGADGVPLLEHAGALVGERRRDARDDLLVGNRAALDPAPRGGFGRELLDDRIRNARAAARLVLVPAGAGLLPVTAHLVEPIRHLRLRSLRARLANRLEVLANARADVDAGDVLHAERTHRHAEVSQRLVDAATRSRPLRAADTPRACNRRACDWRRSRSSCRRRRRPCSTVAPA